MALTDLLPPLNAPTIITILLLIPLLITYTSIASRNYFPTLRNARILLLTAHPDDEAMFFAPTILALTGSACGNHLKVLCLSRGNADGLGDTRALELKSSCSRLGIREEDALCIEDKALQDGFHEWPVGYIKDLLLRYFTQGPEGTTSTIDVVLTFDRGGVSGHPNHRALFEAAKAFAEELHARIGGAGWEVPVALYSLQSVNIVRKYIGAFDVMASIVAAILHVLTRKDKDKAGWDGLRRRTDKNNERKGITDKEGGRLVNMAKLPTHLLYVSGWNDWRKSLGAMIKGHQSQMVWFRWGWISLGRYLWVNDLRRVK